MPRTATTFPPPPHGRDAALDNLRVTAMLLGLVTHGVLPFTATGLTRFPIRDATSHPAADVVYFTIHDFRMQLFFLLAGFAAASLAASRGAAALVRNRLARVALPLAAAALVVSPLMHLLFAGHVAARGGVWNPGAAGGWVGPNFHLWFLYYLLLCTAPLAGLLAVRDRIGGGVVRIADAAARALLASRWRLAVLSAAVVPPLWGMRSWWVSSPGGWVPDVGVLSYYFGFFATGAVLARHRDLLPEIGRAWPAQLAAANLVVIPLVLWLTVTGVRAAADPPAGYAAWKAAAIGLGGLYTWLMIGGLVGLFRRHFRTCRGTWRYLAGASYWCYLAGFPLQVALQIYLAPLGYPIGVEFAAANLVTLGLLLGSYEWYVRRTWVGFVLNGRRETPIEPAAVVVSVRVHGPPVRPVDDAPAARPAAAVAAD